MVWRTSDTRIGTPVLTDTDTVAKLPLGTRIKANDPTYGDGEFIYLKGAATTAIGTWVTYNLDDMSTTLLAANAIGPVGISMSANVASQYGWYQISGMAVIKKTAVAVSPSSGLWLSGTAGRVYATASTGKGIVGARSANLATVASATSTVTVLINRPAIETAT